METDLSLTEIVEENEAADSNWWGSFTKYYDGVLEETDGYVAGLPTASYMD